MAHSQPSTPEEAQHKPEWVIFEYSLNDALADGTLHLMGWSATGKPLVATTGTTHDLPQTELRELFMRFFVWQRDVEPTLPEEDRLFSSQASNDKRVWVIEDRAAVTILYPQEY